MEYAEVLARARTAMEGHCKACPECNGVACGSQIPGPGAKGSGDVARRNFSAWRGVRVNMDTICENKPADTRATLFGRRLRAPIFAGPVGAVGMHYGDAYDDVSYNDVLVPSCADSGIAAFTGDGVNPQVMEAAARAIKEAGGVGVPTIKPWNQETIERKLELVRGSDAFAVAMDVDAAGLPFLKNMTPPAGSIPQEQLAEVIKAADRPFIVKGVMTAAGAHKAAAAGAAGIVVSNHGGRVLDQCPATAEVLGEIVAALNGSGVTVLVDGGLRTGTDVFKALAMGADGVIIARPFATMVYGGGAEGVSILADRLASELADTMTMCGACSIDDIVPEMVRLPR